jgi:hypothetical protein
MMVSFVGTALLAAFHGMDGTAAWFSTRVTNLAPSEAFARVDMSVPADAQNAQ